MPSALPGGTAFTQGSSPLPFDLLDFWKWSASDLLSNTWRGILAEYLVAQAIGIAEGAREEWAAYDLITPEGVKIEVKSSAYLQAWHQEKLSTPQFGIAPTLAWDPTTASYDTERRRQADIYVFCLLHHKERESVNPMDVSQWTFWVVPTAVLDRELGEQKSVGLGTLERIACREVTWEDLRTSSRQC